MDLTQQPVKLDPTACLAAGSEPPLLDTIIMTCEGHQNPLPRDDVNGYSVAGICFGFHGDYADLDGAACTVQYH